MVYMNLKCNEIYVNQRDVCCCDCQFRNISSLNWAWASIKDVYVYTVCILWKAIHERRHRGSRKPVVVPIFVRQWPQRSSKKIMNSWHQRCVSTTVDCQGLTSTYKQINIYILIYLCMHTKIVHRCIYFYINFRL